MNESDGWLYQLYSVWMISSAVRVVNDCYDFICKLNQNEGIQMCFMNW